MSESATNTANIPQTTPTYSVDPKSVTSTLTPSTPARVDMTATQGTTAEPQDKKTESKGFDSNNTSIPTTYAQNYIMPWFGKNPLFQENQHGDRYSLTNSLSNSNLLTLSFKNDFKTQAENRTSFDQARNFFATQDNDNYTYGRVFFKGSWINTRTPIDPNTGEAIGLPEMLPA